MRGAVRLHRSVVNARASIPTPAVRWKQQRSMGFFSNIKKELQDEMDKNKELKDALNKLKSKDVGKKAAPKDDTKVDPAAASEEVSKLAKQAKEAMDEIFGKAKETMQGLKESKSKVAEELKENEFMKTAAQAREELKSKVQETAAAKAAREAAAKVGAAASEAGKASDNLFENKHELGEKTGYFKAKDAKPVEEVDPSLWDTETSTLVTTKAKETEWDRTKARWKSVADKNPVLRAMWNMGSKVGEKTGVVAGEMGDRVFGETDEALTVLEIKERDPEFAIMGFMKEVREVIIPEVLQAFLQADEKTLKARCTDKAYQSMFADITVRKHQGTSYDDRILSVEDVQLAGARVLDNGPTLVITFNAQQIHCIKDKDGGIVDGGPDDIRSVYYTWAFQLDQDAYDLNWQLVEMQTMGAMKMI